MDRQCGRCKGSGLIRKPYKDMWGGRHEMQYCDVCGRNGVNPNYRERNCERCGRAVAYHKDAKFPPKYCNGCKSIVAAERQAKQQERERQALMWREKPCPGLKGGTYCGNTIKYRTDWDRIPDLCQSCRDKLKAHKVEREAKWREKPCAGGCGRTIRYSIDWEHPPSFCADCKQRRQHRHEPRQSEQDRFYAACGRDGANLTSAETERFSEYFHQLPEFERQRMPYKDIVRLANEWKANHGGGFRRSDFA